MSAVKSVNPNADVIGQQHALATNIAAAKSLANIFKTNLGPRGTLKMLVSGAGTVKLTKDGKVLMDEVQIQHPTAMLIARTATAQDDITGDGTTSNVLFTGELLKQAERYLQDGLHPRVLVDGFELARDETLKFVDKFKTEIKGDVDRETLVSVARTSLRTKVYTELADLLTEIVVNAVQCIRRPNEPIDLHMIEIMHMRHKSALDTRFVNGIVLDHGSRHPNMPKRVENAYILVCNVSLEYEKTMVNSGFFYKNADEREKMVAAERKYTDDRVRHIIAFKKQVCEGSDKNFVLINEKGIDPPSLDLLQREGIIALRRAKRRNMERIPLACGGFAVNSIEDLQPDCLGYADAVYEHVLGDDKFTFIEGCKNANSCTILVKGPDDHTIVQIKDSIHDGLRAVLNTIEDNSLIAGAGAFEVAAHAHLMEYKRTVSGRAKLGIQAFADALLIIPKVLAENSGLDTTDAILNLLEEAFKGNVVGLDIETGQCIQPQKLGIWDNHRVKKQFLHLGSLIAMKLLLVDEVMRAGRKMGGKE